jgi:hypothetical protein
VREFALCVCAAAKSQPQKTKRQAKTYPPPAQVCYSRSLSCACHRYMNVIGQTLLLKKKKEGSSNHQTIRHRLFPCGGLQYLLYLSCDYFAVHLTVNISFQKDRFGWFFWLFFATFDLANGTKQRTFPTTVFTQQLEEKKIKKGCGKLSAFAGNKKQKNNKSNFINIPIVDCQ